SCSCSCCRAASASRPSCRRRSAAEAETARHSHEKGQNPKEPIRSSRRHRLDAARALAPVQGALAPFALEETGIAEIHAAMQRGDLTASELLKRYLARRARS